MRAGATGRTRSNGVNGGRGPWPDRASTDRPRPAPRALAWCWIAVLAASAAWGAAGCRGQTVARRVVRQAVTITNASATSDVCEVRVRGAGTEAWTSLGPIDPIAPGRSRTLRLPHGRWSFRFEACERATVLTSPPVDVSFTRVVFLLCDEACRGDVPAPVGAVTVRHHGDDEWGISAPVYVPTGRRRPRLVL